MIKQCNKCRTTKSVTEFNKDKSTSDVYAYVCSECNQQRFKAYYALHSKQVNEKCKEWRAKNSRKAYQKAYYIKHWPTYSGRSSQIKREKRKTDPNFKIAGNLRNRLNMAIKNHQKVGSAVRDLGCSVNQLKQHLEHKFQRGMSWNNYGQWHIDHIRPLSNFDLTNRKEFLEACHYTNLQPLWEADNLAKANQLVA